MNNAPPKVIVIPANPELSKEKAIQRQLRVAAYCRVSTKDEEQLTSYEAQKEYYTEKIMTNRAWTMAGIFPDEGITGTSARKRPKFLEMIRACRQHKIDLILCKSISRFARNTVDCLKYVRLLKELGIAIIFEKENINTLETDTELILTIMSAFAQGESESTSSNISWGKRQAMRDGKVAFQFERLYGYRRGKDNEPEIIPGQAAVVRRIFQSYLRGQGVKAIRNELQAEQVPTPFKGKQWSVSTLQMILRNEKYCGDVLMQKTFVQDCISHKVVKNTGQLPMYLVQDNHAAIIDRHLFDRVQAEIARRTGTKSASQKNCVSGMACYSSKYALTERLVCGECGTLYRRCTWRRNGKTRIVWRCVSRLEYGTKYCKNSPTLDEAPLQNAILEAINIVMSRKDTLVSLVADGMRTETAPIPGESMSVGNIDRRLEALMEETDRLLEESDGADGIQSHAQQFKAIMDESAELKEKKNELLRLQREDVIASARVKDAIQDMEDAPTRWDRWDESLIRQLVDTVEVLGPSRIKVYFKGGVEMERELC